VFSDKRMFCPRAVFPYWRPIWLTPLEREQALPAQSDRVA